MGFSDVFKVGLKRGEEGLSRSFVGVGWQVRIRK